MTNIRFFPRGIPRRVWILSTVSAFLSTGLGMIVPLIPVYGDRLGASHFQLGLLVAGFFAGRLVAQIPAGVATDRVGRRPVLLLALVGYAVTCSGFAVSSTAGLLIAFRVLQGLSAGFFGVAARSLVSDICANEVQGAGQGILSASSNLGFVAGPVVGAFAAQAYQMETPFWAAAILSVLSFSILAVALRPIARTGDLKRMEPVGPGSGMTGLLADPRVMKLAACSLTFWAGLSVIMTLFPVLGVASIRGGLRFVGIAFFAAGICGFVIGPATGRLSDLAGRAPVMAMGALLSAAEGAALLMSNDPVLIWICFGLGGIGVAAFSNGLYAAVGDLTVRSRRGTVNGIVGAAGVIGGIIGAMLGPQIARMTDQQTPFAAQMGFAIVSAIIAVWLWKASPPRTKREVVVAEPIING